MTKCIFGVINCLCDMEASMATNNKNNIPKSAVQVYFGDVYVPEVSNLIYQKYGPSYSTFENLRNRWRAEIRYSLQIEDELILHAKTFIRTMGDDSRYTNPQFLEAFVIRVADYLSAYIMRNPAYVTRKEAKMALKSQLWDNFFYIQNMLAAQARKRLARASRNAAYMAALQRSKQK